MKNLTHDEEIALFATIRTHPGTRKAERATDKLIRAYQPLVGGIAKTFAGRGIEHDDLVQSGYIGLLRAIELFDTELGHRFGTYARHWVRAVIALEVANNCRPIRLPKATHDAYAKLKATEAGFYNALGHEVTDDELADALGMPSDVLRSLRAAVPDLVCIDALPDCVDAFLEAYSVSNDEPDYERLWRVLSVLEFNCLAMRFGMADGEERTVTTVATDLGISRYRVDTALRLAIAKLEHPAMLALI